MPLKAYIDGHRVIAPLLGLVEWQKLKQQHHTAQMGCCQRRGFFSKSRLGTQFFRHENRTGCNWEPETVQHLLAKAEILKACVANGWTTDVEVRIPNGQEVDVLAQNTAKGKRVAIAFEVQWSCQSLDVTEQRQKGIEEHVARVCWLFRKPPLAEPTLFTDNRGPTKRIACFAFDLTPSKTLEVRCYDNRFTIEAWVSALLNRHFSFQHAIVINRARFSTELAVGICSRCSRPSRIFLSTLCYLSRCGTEFCQRRDVHKVFVAAGEPGVDRVLEETARQLRRAQPDLESYTDVFPMTRPNDGIWIHSGKCEWCTEAMNATALKEIHDSIAFDKPNYQRWNIFQTDIPLATPIKLACDHWCFSDSQQFCPG